jgi:hypothetical protein
MVAVGMSLTATPGGLCGDIHLDMLKTRTGSFTNVTVMGKSKTDIFITHARGLGNVKISDITDHAALRALGFGSQLPEETSAAVAASVPGLGSKTSEPKVNPLAGANISQVRTKLAGLTSFRPTPNIVTLIVAFVLGIYLFFCRCLKLICLKTGNDPGILIWFPIAQMVPLLRAAGMPGWWLLGFFVPVVNIVVQIIWCFKIAKARGKSIWAAIGLLFPITNIAALLYLAFSGTNSDEPAGSRRVALAGGPLPVEA